MPGPARARRQRCAWRPRQAAGRPRFRDQAACRGRSHMVKRSLRAAAPPQAAAAGCGGQHGDGLEPSLV
eukprot:11160441-Lingulodinium_polyedra.AAC.1